MSYRFVLPTLTALACSAIAIAPPAPAQGEQIDAATVARIRDEGLARSQVMEHIVWLADVYGPRLEGSPEKEQAAAWAIKTMKSWGLSNVREQRFPFGKGWSLEHFSAEMIEPRVSPLIAYPKAWTPGTDGSVEADVVRADIASESDFAKYRGKLRGKVVLTQPVRMVRMLDGRIVLRMGEKEIHEALYEPSPTPAARSGGASDRFRAMREFREKLDDFYKAEGVVALLDRGSDADSSAGGSDLSWYAQKVDGGTIFVGSGGSRDGASFCASFVSRLPSLPRGALIEHRQRFAQPRVGFWRKLRGQRRHAVGQQHDHGRAVVEARRAAREPQAPRSPTRRNAQGCCRYAEVSVASGWPSFTGDSASNPGASVATPRGNSTITVEP